MSTTPNISDTFSNNVAESPVYTPDYFRARALTHVNYGWTRCPGSHVGPVWTPEQRAIYHDEYDRATGRPGQYRAGVMVDLPNNAPDDLRQAVRAKAAEINTAFAGKHFPTYLQAYEAARQAAGASGFAPHLAPLGD